MREAQAKALLLDSPVASPPALSATHPHDGTDMQATIRGLGEDGAQWWVCLSDQG